MSKIKTIAITGATGFVGKFLVKYFTRLGYKIYAFGRRQDFELEELVEKYIIWDISKEVLSQKIEVDAVIHCAGAVSPWGNYSEMFQVNTLGTQNVFESFIGAKFIHISTASVYDPFSQKNLITEEMVKENINYLNAYQKTKKQAEEMVVKNSANYLIFRPHIIYGPNDTTIFPRLIRARKVKLKRFIILGNGQNQLSLTYVGNLAKAIKLGLESPISNQIFNVTDEVTASSLEILDEFKKVCGFGEKYLKIPKIIAWNLGRVLEIIYTAFRLKSEPILTRYTVSQMTHNYTLDISKIKTMLNYSTTDYFKNQFYPSYGRYNQSN